MNFFLLIQFHVRTGCGFDDKIKENDVVTTTGKCMLVPLIIVIQLLILDLDSRVLIYKRFRAVYEYLT